MINKKQLLETINRLPNKFSAEEIINRIILMQKIEIGLEQSKAGKVLTESDARKKLKKWLK